MLVEITRTYHKQLLKLPKQTIEAAYDIEKKLAAAKNLETSNVDYKKMQGRKNRYRIRVGEYRIITEYINPQIILLIIVKRGDVYKR